MRETVTETQTATEAMNETLTLTEPETATEAVRER